MRHAHSLHCNGYPIHAASKSYNNNRLLYLDSRMSGDMLMGNEELAARLAARAGRPLRLLYSGRYEAMKGALDAVKVGLACLKRGLNIEMHCYGQGNLKDEMRRLASGTPITVHDAVPYPELVKISRTFDIFVCCHIQSDPSCTYLESFGAGLPIAGYANRMWTGLCAASNAGYCSSIGAAQKVARSIESMLAPGLLDTLSWRALKFAEDHRFELEFQKRIESINTAARATEVSESVYA
jgi:colanic acid/amylovoran biosynthesis glycosyltransferase